MKVVMTVWLSKGILPISMSRISQRMVDLVLHLGLWVSIPIAMILLRILP